MDSQEIGNLSRCSHKNIISLYGVYFHRKTLFFEYERVDVSLAEIQSIPYGGFAAFQIVTFYKEVVCPAPSRLRAEAIQILNGIDYIHKELKIAYG